jgi:hypothetical protein
MQRAIRRALGEAGDEGEGRAAADGRSQARQTEANRGDGAGRAETRPGTAKDSAVDPSQIDPADASPPQEHGKPAKLAGQPRPQAKSSDGEPPPASGGAGSGQLLAKAAGSTAGDAAQPFKITLNSFLSAGTGSGSPQKQANNVAAEGPQIDTDWTLSEQQHQDDLLHKPEVPPRFEAVVRRAYQRAEP